MCTYVESARPCFLWCAGHSDSVVLASSPSFCKSEDRARVPKLEPMLPTRLYLVDLSREPAKQEHHNALFLAHSEQFWKQAIYSLYYFCNMHLHCPTGFVLNVKT